MMFALNMLRRIYRIPVISTKLKFWAKGTRVFFQTSVVYAATIINESTSKGSFEKSLSDKTLTQHASSVAVTSVSQLLLLSGGLVIERHEVYRSTLEEIMQLMEQTLMFINSEYHQEKLWNEMVAVRAAIDDSKKELIEMQSFMEYVEKLVTAVAEASYMAGSEFSSTSICELFTSTQQKLEQESRKTKELELEYNRQQKLFVEAMSEKGKVPNLEEISIQPSSD